MNITFGYEILYSHLFGKVVIGVLVSPTETRHDNNSNSSRELASNVGIKINRNMASQNHHNEEGNSRLAAAP